MYIDPKSTICGIPALEARKLMKFLRSNSPFDLPIFERYLKITEKEARTILNKLLKCGYLVEVKKERTYMLSPEDRQGDSIDLYELTDKGGSLACSSAKRYKRKTVETAFNAFMGRVNEVNNSNEHLYRVNKVVVFGSYLGNSEKLSDLDIAVKIVPKITEQDEYLAKTREMVKREANNKRLNILEQAHYGYYKAMKFLRYRSSIISLHEINGDDKELIEKSYHKVVFEDEL